MMLISPSKARAQDPLTLGAVAEAAGAVWTILTAFYGAYESSKAWEDPVATSSIVQHAMAEVQSTIIFADATNMIQQVQTAISDYNYAAVCTGSNCAAQWVAFDTEASAILTNIDTKIQSDPRYAKELGVPYNLLMPLYLQIHVSGDRWGILAIATGSGSNADRLLVDFKQIGQRAFWINFNMIGASSITFPSTFTQKSPFSPSNDTRKKSWLFDYAYNSSTDSGDYDHCYGSNDICVAFLQTSATTQAVQKAQIQLYSLFNGIVSNLTWVEEVKTHTTVIVDPVASWADTWQGYANGLWTSMQATAYGQQIQGNRCPDGSAIVGVWQNPNSWHMAFLCQPIPGYPSWIEGTSTPVQQQPIYSCGSGPKPLCNYDLQCTGVDFANGGGTGSELDCYHRLDAPNTILPTKGTCTHIDYTFNNMPPQGSFYALPAGSYLTGYNETLYGAQKKTSTFYYCGGQVSAGSLGASMNLGSVNGVPYPQAFNVFAFGKVTGLRDVGGPVAAGGGITAASFNINWSSTASAGIVSGGDLNLTNGTIYGNIWHSGAENVKNVTVLPTSTCANCKDWFSSNPINFGSARASLQTMSQNISALASNGSTKIAYGNITLTSINPNLNIFTLAASDLAATTSITINVPSGSTVIINVSGTNVKVANAGFTTYVSAGRTLWNLYQATSFYASSVGIPGSVLAPFANASLGGNINGTLIAETVLSTNEFHQAPFGGNWLVP
jgi:choice-of-anchor A domain-containing protein